MLLGQVIFAAIAVFLKYNNQFPSSLTEMDKVFQVIAIALSFAGFFTGMSLFKKKVQQLKDSPNSVAAKAEGYRSASITQWALLEGPSIFCIICFLLTGNYAFIGLSVALMLLFALAAPAKAKIMLLLGFSEQEMETF